MKKLILYAAALALLSGCAPNAREPDGLALARVLGVDGAGPVTLTAVCGGTDQDGGARGSADGANLEAARQALPWAGEREMALTNLSYIIIGMDADAGAAAAWVMADRELSPSAAMWLTEDAAALLDGSGDPAARLEVLMDSGVSAPTAAEVLAALETFGWVELPVLESMDGELRVVRTVRWEGSG